MGQVWQATDTQLNRQVALKILPDAFASDPDRLARFQREARVLASLNHPNIAAIYGIEKSADTHALVLELVEGPTLADRIAQGPIPVDEALPIAKQIAEALEAAHESGVIHRDLKPANIKVRDDGMVKVLDFGLAKALQPEAADPNMSMSPTMSLTAAATQMGMVIGTAAYMAPEQAKGQVVDKRADIWAYGAVLFEMLTGRRLFDAGDASEMLASVLVKEPDISGIGAHVPSHVRSVVRQCLVKDPKERLRDIGDVRLAMTGVFDAPSSRPAPDVSRRAWHPAVLALGGVAAGALAWGLAQSILTAPPDLEVTRFVVTAAPSEPVTLTTDAVDLAISPDGSTVVYRSGEPAQLYVRALDALEGRHLAGTEGARQPFFSPDGAWIGFEQENALKRMPIEGGTPFTLCALDSPLGGASWGEDGRIVFAASTIPGGLFDVDADGGEPQALTTNGDGRVMTDRWPWHLPGGQRLLFTRATGPGSADKQLAVLDLGTGTQTLLGVTGSGGHYVPTGHLVYGTNGTLWAVPFDPDRIEVLGAPVPVVEGVLTRDGPAAVNFGVASNGSLVYVSGEGTGELWSLAWVDRQGVTTSLSAAPGGYTYPRLSPDGTRVALDVRDVSGGDIWVWSLGDETLTRLTLDQRQEVYPVWTPDSQRVIFGGPRGGLIQAADGTGAAQRVTEDEGPLGGPQSISPDGRYLLWMQNREAGRRDIDIMDLTDQTIDPLLAEPYDERNPVISWDGRWVAYQSDESGRDEIYVRPFPEVEGGKLQVSTTGGRQPAWSPRGDELFYWGGDGFTAVPLAMDGAGLSRGNPDVLFPAEPYRVRDQGRTYDVGPEAERFLMITAAAGESSGDTSQIVHVQNWFQELVERVPVP